MANDWWKNGPVLLTSNNNKTHSYIHYSRELVGRHKQAISEYKSNVFISFIRIRHNANNHMKMMTVALEVPMHSIDFTIIPESIEILGILFP